MNVKDDEVYKNKVCKLCNKFNECDHTKFVKEKFYNGIITQRCKDYEYKE